VPTPVRSSTILAAQVVGGGLIVLLQILVLVAVGVWVFGAKNYGKLAAADPPIVLGTASFVGIGFLITSVTRTSEAARALAAMITFPLMFLSGLFFPISSLPTVVQDIARVLPLAWASDALHQVMNDGAGFQRHRHRLPGDGGVGRGHHLRRGLALPLGLIRGGCFRGAGPERPPVPAPP